METCIFSMKINGKVEGVKKFIDIMETDCRVDWEASKGVSNMKYVCHGDSDRYFWHLDNLYFSDIEDVGNGMVSVRIRGECSYSVYCCMFEGESTYYEFYKGSNGTTLVNESKNLDLDIEVFSSEPVYEFMEHYLIKKGTLLVKDVIDYCEYWLDDYDDVDELNKICGTNFTQEDWDNADEFISIGGIEWHFSI